MFNPDNVLNYPSSIPDVIVTNARTAFDTLLVLHRQDIERALRGDSSPSQAVRVGLMLDARYTTSRWAHRASVCANSGGIDISFELPLFDQPGKSEIGETAWFEREMVAQVTISRHRKGDYDYYVEVVEM